jgi:hypothetical protein
MDYPKRLKLSVAVLEEWAKLSNLTNIKRARLLLPTKTYITYKI